MSAGSIRAWRMLRGLVVVAGCQMVATVAAQDRAVAVTAGQWHSCALTSAGGAKCWGDNISGQVGNDARTDRVTPADVVGLAGGVASIEAGHAHTCAVTTGGMAKCWGSNRHNRVSGPGSSYQVPVDVAGLGGGIASVAAGGDHTCAMGPEGALRCWGSGTAGQLGIGPVTDGPYGVTAVHLPGVTAVTAGARHTCAIAAGGLHCWGDNSDGQLGGSIAGIEWSPAAVPSLASGVAAVAAGGSIDYHTCALTTGGAVKCWGSNRHGQLGTGGSSQDRFTRQDVVGLGSGVAAIATGFHHTCALTTGGGVKCWGENFFGQLGDGSTEHRFVPTDVVSLSSGVTAIAAGGYHTCAVTALGGVKCWGWNEHGGLGDGTLTTRLVPTSVAGLDDADGDGIPNDLEQAEGRDPALKDNDVFADARLFAMQQYRDLLFREGEPAGVAGWSGAIAGGASYRERAVDSFIMSAESGELVAPVARLYFASFQRPPDREGLVFNARLLREGKATRLSLAELFAAGPEFLATYGSLDDAQFVTRLYANVLGRAPDAAGLAGWVALLGGGASRGAVLLGFSDSAEFQASIANEVFATMIYTGLLGRSPDPLGFPLWVAYLDSGPYLHEYAIDAILRSAEYRARFLP